MTLTPSLADRVNALAVYKEPGGACRPDLHTDAHDKWDAGGHCNELVVEEDGTANECGFVKEVPGYAATRPASPLERLVVDLDRAVDRLHPTYGARVRVAAAVIREEYMPLRRQLASPPQGWFPFGYHAGPGAAPELEFWGNDEDGMPLWERPKVNVYPSFCASCDFCGGDVHSFVAPIHPNGTATTHVFPAAGSGSDHLATWCGTCGPKHRDEKGNVHG